MNQLQSVSTKDIEGRTLELGRYYCDQLTRRSPTMFDTRWWDDQLLRQLTSDPAMKVQMFRFVDVLPMLKSHQSVNRHLHEYFEEIRNHLPLAVKLGLDITDNNPIFSRVISFSARMQARRMAHKFIAGENAEEVLHSIKKIRDQGFTCTLDLLGEEVITPQEAHNYQQKYLEILRDMGPMLDRWVESPQVDSDLYGPIPKLNLSLKVSALDSSFSPLDPTGTINRVGQKLREIFDLAMDVGAFINLDMESYSTKALTYRLFREILMEPAYKDWRNVGIVCQAYLKDSLDDLHELKTWAEKRGTPITIRLVKGAYWDYETITAEQKGWPVPVFQQKWQSDENFERLSTFLLEHHELLRPAFGSHNIRSLAHAVASAEIMQVPDNSYEIQMLYGMAGDMAQIFSDDGLRVRIYTPFGEMIPGMAYLVRRLLENTSNESFLLNAFSRNIAVDELMKNPTQIGKLAQPIPAKTPLYFENEPLTDFTQTKACELMQKALDKVQDQLGEKYPLVIGGKSYDTRNTLTSTNPANTKEVIGKISLANIDFVNQAVEAARSAFNSWSKTSVDYRAEYLQLVASRIKERKYELAAWIILETGKTWTEADADVAEAIDFCLYYALECQRISVGQQVDLPGEENAYFYKPRGVCVVIAPWNFPLAILTGMTVAAVVTGNTVIMKPAEQSPVVASKLMDIFRDIHLPEGVVNYLPGVGEDVGPALVTHPNVDLIAFTGSREVGLAINRQAAEPIQGQIQVKKVIAEMGGKNAIIVDDDADLDAAVLGVMHSAFGYSGQKCSACSRVIVLADVYNQFCDRLKGAVSKLKIGNPIELANNMGPVIDADAKAKIHSFIEQAKTEHTLLTGDEPEKLPSNGHFIAPHIFTNVTPEAKIAQEEIFGPVLVVIKAKDFKEALDIANQTPYALTGGVYSRSPQHLQQAKMEFNVGNLYLNRNITGALVYRQPFGGFKLSGIGSKAGGPDYLFQFMIPINVTENTMRRGFAPNEVAE